MGVNLGAGLEAVHRATVGARCFSCFGHIQKHLGVVVPHRHFWIGAKRWKLIAIQLDGFVMNLFVGDHDYTRVNQCSYLLFRP